MLDEAKEVKEIKIKELLCRHKIPQSAQRAAKAALSELYDDLVAQYERDAEWYRKYHMAPLEEENCLLRSQAEGERLLANYLFEQLIEYQLRAGGLIEKTP